MSYSTIYGAIRAGSKCNGSCAKPGLSNWVIYRIYCWKSSKRRVTSHSSPSAILSRLGEETTRQPAPSAY